MPKRTALLSVLCALLLAIGLDADFCYTGPCRPGIPGTRIYWQCGSSGSLPYYSCCAGEGWDWAYGYCYTDSQCREGSFVCYYYYDGIYGSDVNCCSR
jgi:hypothetical protein